MNIQTFKTPWSRTSGLTRALTIDTLAAGAWALSVAGSQAHARSDVQWSSGVNTPGVAVGVSNGYYGPPPVYYAPRPIYYEPRPIYYAPPPVYYAPRPVYRSGWGPAPRWERDRRDHWRGDHGHRRGDRYDGRRGRD